MPAPSRRFLCFTASFLVAVLSAGCDKEDKIIVQNLPPSQENRPPLIITYSPDFPPGVIEQVSSPEGILLQVLVGDPDGLDDISVVTVDIDSVIVRRFILRPDTSSSGCLRFGYAPNDTVPTQSILTVPATFPGLKLRQMTKATGGLYFASTFGGPGYGYPYIVDAASNLLTWPGGCLYPEGFGGPWIVQPPAVATENEAVLTYLDVDYRGNRVKVWDKVGANATLQLPNLRIVYTTLAEKNAAP